MNWTQCVKNMAGRNVTITKQGSGINTFGKKGKVLNFDRQAGKYEISFGNGFCGWYCRNEFELH